MDEKSAARWVDLTWERCPEGSSPLGIEDEEAGVCARELGLWLGAFGYFLPSVTIAMMCSRVAFLL